MVVVADVEDVVDSVVEVPIAFGFLADVELPLLQPLVLQLVLSPHSEAAPVPILSVALASLAFRML